MIYTSEAFSTALLEKLVHGSGRLPPNQHYVTVTIPTGVPYEVFDAAAHSGWDNRSCKVSRAFGHDWQNSARSLILIVPSVVARTENNILINRQHPDFHKLFSSLHKPVYWDRRLFP
jgi:RES domain-containing protein